GRAVRIELDPARIAAAGVTAGDLRLALPSANARLPLGELLRGNRAGQLAAGSFLETPTEVGDLPVGGRDGTPVQPTDLARVAGGPLPPRQYVWHGVPGEGEFPAITLSVTKKPGENAIDVASAVLARVAELRNSLIPDGVEVAETRNYGATADDKARQLIQKLLFATLSVVALVFLAL